MLAEKEQDIAQLQARLRTSEALHGEALSRLEGLEVKLGAVRGAATNGGVDGGAVAHVPGTGKSQEEVRRQLANRIDALERLANAQGLSLRLAMNGPSVDRGAMSQGGGAAEALEKRVALLEHVGMGQDVADKLRSSNQQIEILSRKLEESQSEQRSAMQQATRWRAEAEALQRKVDDLTKTVADAREAAAAASAREVETVHAKLAQSVSQASLLRSQLKSREADVHRLECRVAELQGWGPAATGEGLDTTLASSNSKHNMSLDTTLRMSVDDKLSHMGCAVDPTRTPMTPGPPCGPCAAAAVPILGTGPAPWVAAPSVLPCAAHGAPNGSWTPPGRGPHFGAGPPSARTTSPHRNLRMQSAGTPQAGFGPPVAAMIPVSSVDAISSGRLSRASSGELRVLRDASPQAVQHLVSSGDGVTVLMQRSQSVPVHRVVSAQPSSPATAVNNARGAGCQGAVSLARWANSPPPSGHGHGCGGSGIGAATAGGQASSLLQVHFDAGRMASAVGAPAPSSARPVHR